MKKPFGGKQAPPFGRGESKADMARDKKRGIREGSKEDERLDRMAERKK